MPNFTKPFQSLSSTLSANPTSQTQEPSVPPSRQILGDDLTQADDIPDGAHTPLAWKEAKRPADSKIITEMPAFKFGNK
ncbi:hypothetical protein ABW19_dt0205035 [Dactylella cylindrospora]|nr:hypothetical protein ABW19_dt0205035 [Dactylella cylindrospora]